MRRQGFERRTGDDVWRAPWVAVILVVEAVALKAVRRQFEVERLMRADQLCVQLAAALNSVTGRDS